jgi:HK97 family phage major capsid protein
LNRIDQLDGEETERAKKFEAAKTNVQTSRGDSPRIEVKPPNVEQDPKCGFTDVQDMFRAVLNTGLSREVDDRLRPLAAAGSDEHGTYSDPHGGFLIPEQLMPGVLSTAPEVDPTAGLVRDVPMEVHQVSFNARVDKNHSSSVSGGLTVSREPETQAGTSSRMKFEQVKLEAKDLVGIAYVSERLIETSPVSIVALINAGFSDEFPSQILKEKIDGDGAGEAEGLLQAAATISVAKESGQAADTIKGANLVKMRKRQWRYGRSIWMANHDTYDTLATAHVSGTNDDVFLFKPGNGVDVPDTLLGRPIYFTEYCKTLGDKGDIINADWSQYLWGSVVSGLRQRESIHVRFLEMERTLQVYTCNDGRSWWKSALTPVNSSSTLSPFVTLAERA